MKLYVESGSIKEVVNAETYSEGFEIATLKSVDKNGFVKPGMIMVASEIGFVSDADPENHDPRRANDMFILATIIMSTLEANGLIEFHEDTEEK